MRHIRKGMKSKMITLKLISEINDFKMGAYSDLTINSRTLIFILAWDSFKIFALKIGMEWNHIFQWHSVLMKLCFSSLLTALSFLNTYAYIHTLLKKEVLPQ